MQNNLWNSGRMACYLSMQQRLQLIMLWKMRQNILISSISCSENHQNTIITVTFDIHHITWPGRKNHYKVRTRKLKWGNLVLFLCSSTNLNSGASSSSVNPNPICIICDEHDAIENLHAAAVFHASKSKLNMLWSWKIIGEI